MEAPRSHTWLSIQKIEKKVRIAFWPRHYFRPNFTTEVLPSLKLNSFMLELFRAGLMRVILEMIDVTFALIDVRYVNLGM